MNKGRTLALLLSVLLTFLLFASACGSNEEEKASEDSGQKNEQKEGNKPANQEGDKENETPPADEKKEPVTLKLITWNVGLYQEAFDMFHEKYPWITIEPIITGGSDDALIEKAAAMQTAGDPADLTWLQGLSDWTNGGLLEDLTPFIENDPTIQNAEVVEGFTDAFRTGDKIYAMPFSRIAAWIVVNKDLLKKHGMEMPSNDWTYDDFLEMAKKATDPAASEYGISYDQTMYYFLNWIYPVANGSADNLIFMNKNLTQSVANTPEVIADLKWLQDLTTKWHVRPTAAEGEKLGWERGNNFLTGKVLFSMGLDWLLPGYQKEAKFEWDILPMPRGKATQATLQIQGPTAILSASKHKAEAFLWLSFQYELEMQKWMMRNGSNTWVIHPELEDYIDQVPLWQGKNKEAVKMTTTMCCGMPGASVPDWSEYQGTIDTAIIGPMYDGSDLNAIIPKVEAFNKKTLESRKLLGW
ncbi:extracellular solute-binding protein [Paenibacillus mendelii]|uniref:Extracellular solute-binding protein n=1 Tax=Paenibacillus mendelii TaxID=206163 RepID=A0ABV6JFY1_9BACL|nr:extracellular solute-binding protein [Paenibacillus mendelii]MCQ6557680.1 extracellular solute-binding protein [Paenibacillus mendelii]